MSQAQGYPLVPNASWPAGRDRVSLLSNNNLLWLFGGANSANIFGDLSTFSDGMIYYILYCYKYCQILFCAPPLEFLCWLITATIA